MRIKPLEPESEDNPIDTELPLAAAEQLLASLPGPHQPTDTAFTCSTAARPARPAWNAITSFPSQGDGEKILRRIEQRACAMGLECIFVLTTRTMHSFLKRGFVAADLDRLPEARKRKYNWDRKSMVFVKKL